MKYHVLLCIEFTNLLLCPASSPPRSFKREHVSQTCCDHWSPTSKIVCVRPVPANLRLVSRPRQPRQPRHFKDPQSVGCPLHSRFMSIWCTLDHDWPYQSQVQVDDSAHLQVMAGLPHSRFALATFDHLNLLFPLSPCTLLKFYDLPHPTSFTQPSLHELASLVKNPRIGSKEPASWLRDPAEPCTSCIATASDYVSLHILWSLLYI
jgi:hypothetical protein